MPVVVDASGASVDPSITDSIFGDISGVVAYAQNRVAAVDGFLSGLTNQVLTLVAPSITPQFPTLITAPTIRTDTAPAITQPVFVAPAMPLAFTGSIDTTGLDVEPFDISPPTLNFPSAPAAFAGALPAAPSVDLQFTYPGLTVDLPTPPPLLSINTIPFTGFNLPTFNAIEPNQVLLIAPGIVQYEPGSLYTSALLTQLQTHLQGVIANGSDGLTLPGEKAIWDRGREREAYSQVDALAKLDQMEGLGYAFAPGIWLNARLKIINEAVANERGYNREATAKSAELALDYLKTAIGTATELEGHLIDYNNQVEQRLFESCKYATEAGISIYNAKVQAFQAMTEVYKTKVQIYSAEIAAQTALIDAYRAQVEAEKLKVDINDALIAEFKALIDAAMTNVEIYKAELEGIQIKADVEKTKVELFGQFVQAYATQVNAYTAQIEAYKASLSAEQTKEQVYATQVDAYKALVEAQGIVIRNRVDIFKSQIDAKQLEYEGYKTAIEGATAAVDASVKGQGLLVDIYRTNITADQSYNQVLTAQWQAVMQQTDAIANIGIAAAKANGDLYISSRGLALEGAKASAQVSAQIAAAGINAVNFSGSVSVSESASGSLSRSASTSDATSTSTNTNYNYSV